MGIISPVCYLVARPLITRALVRMVAPLALVNVFNVVCGLVSATLTPLLHFVTATAHLPLPFAYICYTF